MIIKFAMQFELVAGACSYENRDNLCFRQHFKILYAKANKIEKKKEKKTDSGKMNKKK